MESHRETQEFSNIYFICVIVVKWSHLKNQVTAPKGCANTKAFGPKVKNLKMWLSGPKGSTTLSIDLVFGSLHKRFYP